MRGIIMNGNNDDHHEIGTFETSPDDKKIALFFADERQFNNFVFSAGEEGGGTTLTFLADPGSDYLATINDQAH